MEPTEAAGSDPAVATVASADTALHAQPGVHLAVELDRDMLRADFWVGHEQLPVMFPLRELTQYLFGAWVSDSGVTTMRLWVQLRSGICLRVTATGGAPGQLPVLRVDTVSGDAGLRD